MNHAKKNVYLLKMDNQASPSLSFTDAPVEKTQLNGCVNVNYFSASPNQDSRVCVRQVTTKSDAFKMCGE